MQVEREYHGISLQAIAGYLVELGGTMIGEDRVGGNGWNAHLSKGEPFKLGALQLGTVRVLFEGNATELKRLLAAFDLKMIRVRG